MFIMNMPGCKPLAGYHMPVKAHIVSQLKWVAASVLSEYLRIASAASSTLTET